MHQDTKEVEARLERFVRDRLFPSIYSNKHPLVISAWEAAREPVPFYIAKEQEFKSVPIGWKFGRAWSTTWLRVSGEMPFIDQQEEFYKPEILVDFGYNRSRSGFQAEALAYSPSGTPIKSIAPKNSWLPWPIESEYIEFYLEVAANPDVAGEYSFAPTNFGEWETSPEVKLYALNELCIALLDERVWGLTQDVIAIQGLMNSLPDYSTRRHNLLRACENMLDIVSADDVSKNVQHARNALATVLNEPASASSHKVIATGHAHIDTAWLWPLRESIRKCARTFSNVLSLMQKHPKFVFSCSSAQHYVWMRDFYPEIYSGILERVKSGQWVPVGGMWVECDGNLPGSEAMVRQFVYGQKFFQDNFGIRAKEAWLPDSFGYSGALPQIIKQSGLDFFLSQKMSWNKTNTMPHHTFWWEGIDGTRVFSHFPSADTYNSELTGQELGFAEKNFAEKGRASISLIPFGWGDGGGGPTREMLGAAYRTENLEGSPRVSLGSAAEFFEAAHQEYPNAPVWRGEMYLEVHRGVFTSQLRTKQGNRRNEALLREAELWSTYATLRTGMTYPAEQLRKAWEEVLLLQFHDILPGTSIAWVHREAEIKHQEISQTLNKIIQQSLSNLVNDLESSANEVEMTSNVSASEKSGISPLAVGIEEKSKGQALLQVIPEGVILENRNIRVIIDKIGHITSFKNLSDGREAISPNHVANEFHLHADSPNKWDAWDIDFHYKRRIEVLNQVTSYLYGQSEAGHVWLEIVKSISSSEKITSIVKEKLVLYPDALDLEIELDIDWHEKEKLLKLSFPIDVHAEQVAAEVQFGHVWRPTHVNTSWDYARFETCQHKFVHLREENWGIAFANDSSYGYDISRNTDANGSTITTLRFSLIRAARFPDPNADQGLHSMKFRIKPGASILEAVKLGYSLNYPERRIMGNRIIEPLVFCDADEVIIETVKLAEDGSGDLIVRLYESIGSRVNCNLRLNIPFETVSRSSLLEEPLDLEVERENSIISLELRPFQIATLRFYGVKK